MNYKIHKLAGRCADGAERDRGRRAHALPVNAAGRVDDRALCGAAPGRRSAGWSSWDEQAVTCPRCLVRLPAPEIAIAPAGEIWLCKTASVGKTIVGQWIETADRPPQIPRPRPEDDPNLSAEQRAALAHVERLTTPEALELLSSYQRIENPHHRATVRRLARILANEQAGNLEGETKP